MRVYFLRHGVAGKRSEWRGDDDARPLTKDGRDALYRAAMTFSRIGLTVDAVVTSPLARARQTAEIVAEKLRLSDKLVDDERLAHGFDAAALRAVIGDHRGAGAIMVVGHEPDFSETIAELTGGRVVMKKGALARVDLAEPAATSGDLVWLLQPQILTR